MRILFAEDERSLSKAVVALLEKNNYSVDAVYDGEEALNYIVLKYSAMVWTQTLSISMQQIDF